MAGAQVISEAKTTDFGDQTIKNVTEIQLKSIVSDDDTSVSLGLGTDAGDDFIVATDALVVLGETAKRGYVGIGTAAPTSALDVRGGIVTSGKLVEVATGTTGTPSGDAGIIIERGDSTNATLIWDESRDEFVLGTTSATGASTGDLTVTRGNLSVARIGAGTEQAEAQVHVKNDTAGSPSYSTTAPIIVEDDDRPGIQFVGGASNIALIQFGDNAAAASGQIYYDHSTDKLRIDAGGSTDRLTVDASGNVAAAGVVTATGFTIGSAVIGETELEILDGATLSTTELNYVKDVSSAIQTQLDAKSPTAGHSSIATVGTVGTGTWQGTAVASAYLDAQTAHLDTTQTFSGAKTFSAASTHAGVSLSEATSLSISAPALATTDHTAAGVTAVMLAGAAIAAFEVVCVSTTSGKIVKSDSTVIGTMPVVGIATEAFSGDDETGTVLLQGFIRDDTWSWTPGSILYASETGGAMTHTAPTTSGAFVQALGVALTAKVVKFMPSLTLVEVA